MQAPAARAAPPVQAIPFGAFADTPALAAAYDRAVDASLDIDRFCSQHAFATAALQGLQAGRPDRIFRVGDGWLVFAERRASLFGDPRERRVWEPLEAMWGLCCPLVGTDESALALGLASVANQPSDEAPVLLLCGLARRSARLHAVAAALRPTHRLIESTETVRQVASLEGGFEPFLARRSPRFRANLRRSLRAARQRGLRYERHAPSSPEEALRLYARAVALDDVSWKGRSEAGLRASGLYAFYEHMLPRLARGGSLRIGFFLDGDEDVAYLFGGVRHAQFRGLQFAFRAGREAESLGNVVQLLEVEQLCHEGVLRYDLGAQADYKRHWGEQTDRTTTLIAVPRRPPIHSMTT